jgi:hypothetical protein
MEFRLTYKPRYRRVPEVNMARTDFLTRQREQIVSRLEELRPLYQEYLTLEKAQEALNQLGEPVRRVTRRGRGRPAGRRGPGRPPGRRTTARSGNGRRRTTAGSGNGRRRTTAGSGSGRRRTTAGRTSARRTTTRRSTATRSGGRGGRTRARRSRAGGTRAEQTFAAIQSQPGITIPELASKLNVRPNYLYRVTAELQKDRRVRKRGRGFHASNSS